MADGPRVRTFLVPIVCRRCGTQKRGPDGRAMYIDMEWQRGKRMVCPECFEAEQTMQALETLVSWDDDGLEDVPF